ncbi:C40 family peptidase [Paenibacillus pectinilyticus]|uniref:C40 family peptidase n=1 Tax=Paenibacillus pectinilyticus TaxID=512399 RepID=UPI001FCA0D31|nr:NlpC/P60 family protein [Paenibacillus pectinilyticus]
MKKDFFENTRKSFKNKIIILLNGIRYLALDDVLEILEYDLKGGNARFLFATDGSEFIFIPRQGGISRSEGVNFRMDPLLTDQGKRYVSFRSINRLFNVDITSNLATRKAFIRQPGLFFITFKGDTLKSLSELLNTTIARLLAINKNLKEPIVAGIHVRIPTIQPNSSSAKRGLQKAIRIKETEKAPDIIALGMRLRGTPYRFGAGPYPRSRRFDCSSYLQYIFGRNGISLPRTTRSQATLGKRIAQKDVEAGDVIFFRRPRIRIIG